MAGTVVAGCQELPELIGCRRSVQVHHMPPSVVFNAKPPCLFYALRYCPPRSQPARAALRCVMVVAGEPGTEYKRGTGFVPLPGIWPLGLLSMLAKLNTYALVGIDGLPLDAQCDRS